MRSRLGTRAVLEPQTVLVNYFSVTKIDIRALGIFETTLEGCFPELFCIDLPCNARQHFPRLCYTTR